MVLVKVEVVNGINAKEPSINCMYGMIECILFTNFHIWSHQISSEISFMVLLKPKDQQMVNCVLLEELQDKGVCLGHKVNL